MRMEEFLNIFRDALAGKVPGSVIEDNMNYYRNYIISQRNSGISEEEVLAGLGDPRLLAKTIEESNKFAQKEENGSFYQETDNNPYHAQTSYGETENYEEPKHLPGWLTAVIIVAVVALIITVTFSLISFFAPVILVIVLISLVCSLLRAWRQRF